MVKLLVSVFAIVKKELLFKRRSITRSIAFTAVPLASTWHAKLIITEPLEQFNKEVESRYNQAGPFVKSMLRDASMRLPD